MRRSPRTTLLTLPLAVLALAAAGCGGSEVAADEVPGSPPALTVPTDSELSTGDADADADADATADPDATPDAEAPAGEATVDPDAAVVPEDSSGGAVAPETDEAPATAEEPAPAEEPPPAGSAPEQFESFCEQNAGAC